MSLSRGPNQACLVMTFVLLTHVFSQPMLENNHLFKFLFLIDWAGKTNKSLCKTDNALQGEGGTEPTPGERMRGQKMEEERRGDMRKQANCHLSLKQIFRPAADTV